MRPVVIRAIRGEVAKSVRLPVSVAASVEPAPAREIARAARRRRLEEDPFAPLGLRLAGVRYLPSFEGDVGYDSNPNRQGGGHKGSAFGRTEGQLKIQSDWLTHELKGNLRGAYSDYRHVPEASRPEGEGKLSLRLDARKDTVIDFESRFKLDTERPGSVNLPTSTANRPLDVSYGGSAGITQKFNRLSVGLRGSADHSTYEDVKLNNGTTQSQRDRDYSQYALRLRTGYELTPGLLPFVETEIDTRQHDQPIDNSGFARNSDGVTGRLGTTFELTRLLTGEVAAGYQVRRYDDPRLMDLRGPVAMGTLNWSLTPITTVRFTGVSRLDETSVVGSNGTLARSLGIELEHAFQRNFVIIGAATFSHNDYRGLGIKENGFAASLKVDYKLTRELVLRGSYIHERLDSTTPGSDYRANVVMVGLRLQR